MTMFDSFTLRRALVFGAVMVWFAGLAQAQNARKTAPVLKGTISQVGNWTVFCPPVDDRSGVRCAARLSLIDKQRKIPVIVWRIGFNKEQKMLMDLVTPTDVTLSKGVRLTVGRSTPVTLPYISCGSQGCLSRIAVEKKLLNSMANAENATLAVTTKNGKAMHMKINAKGLAAALKAIGGT
jgi:invasion protein IalB